MRPGQLNDESSLNDVPLVCSKEMSSPDVCRKRQRRMHPTQEAEENAPKSTICPLWHTDREAMRTPGVRHIPALIAGGLSCSNCVSHASTSYCILLYSVSQTVPSRACTASPVRAELQVHALTPSKPPSPRTHTHARTCAPKVFMLEGEKAQPTRGTLST